MVKFSTRARSAFISGLRQFMTGFFAGMLVEGALMVMGALTLYNLPQFTIPSVLGALNFLRAQEYEASRQMDAEDK